MGNCCQPSQKAWHLDWRLQHSSSIRGNFVRIRTTDIAAEYEVNKEAELGKGILSLVASKLLFIMPYSFEGGCGIVVVGHRHDTGAEYAIKIVSKVSADAGRLEREITLMKDLDHANIVRLFEVYDVSKYMYFVMELCSGGHLGDLLRRQSRRCLDEGVCPL